MRARKRYRARNGDDAETVCPEAFVEKATDLTLSFLATNP